MKGNVLLTGSSKFMGVPNGAPSASRGRVTSMMKFGSRRGVAELRKASQSARLRGEKSFVPAGQLFV